jgi:hypothetical protein
MVSTTMGATMRDKEADSTANDARSYLHHELRVTSHCVGAVGIQAVHVLKGFVSSVDNHPQLASEALHASLVTHSSVLSQVSTFTIATAPPRQQDHHDIIDTRDELVLPGHGLSCTHLGGYWPTQLSPEILLVLMRLKDLGRGASRGGAHSWSTKDKPTLGFMHVRSRAQGLAVELPESNCPWCQNDT